MDTHSQITESIFISDWYGSLDINQLTKNNIKYVLSCSTIIKMVHTIVTSTVYFKYQITIPVSVPSHGFLYAIS